ncbi:hypothetical protein Lepto7376_3214 [[Leptolyngbya] sp. PCC 7376]|nr:hypothetical protein [[Leptolyngbya] sp. PCC 7376]AFY39443.1 hypothetical protein Lepto7376_3214 [[Leptolyngbya] sp. PCC 7376]
MSVQLIAVLQLTGIFAAFLGAYVYLLEYLMPSPSRSFPTVSGK